MSKSTIPPHVSPDRVRDIDRLARRVSPAKATKFKETMHAQCDNTIPR